MATDTAFVIGGLALFGSSIPAQLRIFLVSLAIFDDVGAISVVAIAYGETLNFGALSLAMLGLGVVAISARTGIGASRSILCSAAAFGYASMPPVCMRQLPA